MAATTECSYSVRADSDRGAGFHVSPTWFATLILNNALYEILTFATLILNNALYEILTFTR